MKINYLLVFGILMALIVVFETGILVGLTNPGVKGLLAGLRFSPVEITGVTQEEIGGSAAYAARVDEVRNMTEGYYGTHLYLVDVYDCDQMASDLWNQLTARGLNAKLVMGNVMKDVKSIDDINHAWVIVEIYPGAWLALDPCTGSTVFNKWSLWVKSYGRPDLTMEATVSGARYYHGMVFDNPQEMMWFGISYMGAP